MENKLFRRDFSLVVAGQIISILGSAVLRFALNLYILDMTGRADIFGILIAISAIPAILFTPLGGAIADRFNRRNLMVIFDFSASAVVIVLLILLILQGGGYLPVVVIGVFLVVLSMISSMYQPAVQASVPVLVCEEKLASGNGIVTGVGALSGLLGPVLGGVLYGIVGLNALVTASCAAFFLSAVMEMFIRMPFAKPGRDKSMALTIIDDMKLGLRYVVREKPTILKLIILAAALNLFMSPLFIVGVPYILRITLNSSEGMYGIGMGILELSSIIGAILTGAVTKKLRLSDIYRLLLVASVLILPIALSVTPVILGFGYWQSFAMMIFFSALVTALATMLSVFVITVVQKVTPNEILGKVMGIIMAVAGCAAPLGMALYGFAFEQFSNAIYIPVLAACVFTIGISFTAKICLKGAEV
ncbi:MAG: MFS transporter [Oscillospiraceae bacterium]|nr:MFS transporter [Oscillospiraceae bacterium]